MGHPKRSLFATLNVQYSWSSEIMVMEEEEETPYLTGVDNSMMYTCIRISNWLFFATDFSARAYKNRYK